LAGLELEEIKNRLAATNRRLSALVPASGFQINFLLLSSSVIVLGGGLHTINFQQNCKAYLHLPF
jgi:hypothetical protein